MTLPNKKHALTPVILGLLFLASAAQAEYVCEVTITDNLNGSTYGEHGFVLARYYTERNCGGNFVTQQWYCTANATASYCAASTRYRYSEPALLSLYEKLSDAAFWGRQVRFTRVGCMNGSSDCGGPVYITSQY